MKYMSLVVISVAYQEQWADQFDTFTTTGTNVTYLF